MHATSPPLSVESQFQNFNPSIFSHFISFIRRFVVTLPVNLQLLQIFYPSICSLLHLLSVNIQLLQFFYPSICSHFRSFIRQCIVISDIYPSVKLLKFFYPLLYTLKLFVDLQFQISLSSSDTSTVDSQLQILPSNCDSSSFLSDGLKLQILYPSNDDSRDGIIQ